MLDLVDTRYVWGGENSTGIDCSGLPRKALRDALLRRGISRLDGRFLRQWLEQWWFDVSAEALAKNYRNYTVSLPISGTIRTMNYQGIEVGDLAITDNGVHVLVYLGDNRWIQADPHVGKVIINNGRVDRSAWLDLPATIYRCQVLT
jgi:cell wall-associated NlpC family hydrolase